MLSYLSVDLRHVSAALGPHVLLYPLCMPMHAISHDWIQRDRHQACGVSPVFEELSLGVGQRVERADRIGAEPRERRDIVGAGEHVHRVDLECVQQRRQLAESPDGGTRWSQSESL